MKPEEVLFVIGTTLGVILTGLIVIFLLAATYSAIFFKKDYRFALYCFLGFLFTLLILFLEILGLTIHG